MKRIVSLLIILAAGFSAFAQTSKIKFIKGNIADKTAAVREAKDSDAEWITEEAVAFCLENKEILGNDRELDGLAVAAILSYSPDKIKKQSDSQKQKITDNLISLFTDFNKSSTVQIAVISKAVALKDSLPSASFTALLNSYLKTTDIAAWAKESTKPSYTAAEVGALPNTYTPPVVSVNGQTGAVSLAIPAAQVQSN